ncbi:MAG: hypothetical protein ABII25_07325 [bacterium]
MRIVVSYQLSVVSILSSRMAFCHSERSEESYTGKLFSQNDNCSKEVNVKWK